MTIRETGEQRQSLEIGTGQTEREEDRSREIVGSVRGPFYTPDVLSAMETKKERELRRTRRMFQRLGDMLSQMAVMRLS